VVVARQVWNRGYRWTVSFAGVPGDVGLIQADSSMITGDEPIIEILEITKGSADIVPDAYTYEVQTVRLASLASLQGSGGTFILNMEGYNTPPINFDESAQTFMQKLESLPVIHTVKVTRELVNAINSLYAWTVTFTNMKHEVVQGAGNIPPFTLVSTTFSDSLVAEVMVFEVIKGTHPFQYTLTNLLPSTEYNVRIIAYNDRGFSLHSAVASALALGQPPRLGKT
jgi:hypothetical protein